MIVGKSGCERCPLIKVWELENSRKGKESKYDSWWRRNLEKRYASLRNMKIGDGNLIGKLGTRKTITFWDWNGLEWVGSNLFSQVSLQFSIGIVLYRFLQV